MWHPAAAAAVRRTAVPDEYDAEHVAPQETPPMSEVTVPVPVPVRLTLTNKDIQATPPYTLVQPVPAPVIRMTQRSDGSSEITMADSTSA